MPPKKKPKKSKTKPKGGGGKEKSPTPKKKAKGKGKGKSKPKTKVKAPPPEPVAKEQPVKEGPLKEPPVKEVPLKEPSVKEPVKEVVPEPVVLKEPEAVKEQPVKAEVLLLVATVAIAPDDYEHIFHREKGKEVEGKVKIPTFVSAVPPPETPAPVEKSVKVEPAPAQPVQLAQPAPPVGNGPVEEGKLPEGTTMAIAPDDYEHIYCKGKGLLNNIKLPDAFKSTKQVSPGAPETPVPPPQPPPVELSKKPELLATVAIAPDDYEHIYRKEGGFEDQKRAAENILKNIKL